VKVDCWCLPKQASKAPPNQELKMLERGSLGAGNRKMGVIATEHAVEHLLALEGAET
jgi:hypothetical protein